MAAEVGVQARTRYARRTRHVWSILALSTALFLTICATGAVGAYSYLDSITRTKDARLQLVSGSQLSVVRHGRLDREVVPKDTVLNEGDEVYTGRETEANMSLFDGSTVRLSFNTHIKLSSLRTSRFFSNRKEVDLRIDSGTFVLSTADADGYTSASYTVNTPHASVEVERNSTVRVRISDLDKPGGTEVSVTADSAGSATVTSGGKRVVVHPRYMTSARLNTGPTDPQPDEQELIRNGDFTEPPTSQAEGPEVGLNTAAWLPILERPSDDVSGAGTVTVTTEYDKRVATIDREAQGEHYARLGLRQDIDTSASYFRAIELSASVKVVAQTETEPVGGPQGDVFPLTIKVLYTDSSGLPQEWNHSFYVCPSGHGKCELENADDVPLGKYTTVNFLLKGLGSSPTAENQPSLNLDISAVNSIEIYGIGNRFQSWITDISLKAR